MARRFLLVLGCLLLPLAAASAATATKGFESPTHNIGCVMSGQVARCDIKQHSWPTPKRPASCEFGYGNSVFVDDQGAAEFGCVSDSAFDAGPVLPYGESLRKGRFVCASSEIGVRCVDLRDGHGFFLSRQRVKLF